MNKNIQELHDKKLPAEIAVVKQLGEQIGYGHLMELASALWRKKLQETDTPIEGAFVLTIIYDIKKSGLPSVQKSCEIYDSIIKEYNHE